MKFAIKHVELNSPQYIDLQLPSHDFDINLTLPNGDEVLVQWRAEGGSLDVCLPQLGSMEAWKDDNLTPADLSQKMKLVKQVMFCLPCDEVEECA